MKKIAIAVFLSCFVAPSAFSLNDNAEPANAALLEVRTYGGYTSPEFYGYEKGVRIYSDGSIEGFRRQNGESEPVKVSLGKLAQDTVDALRQRIFRLPLGKLAFPNTPECTDFPVTSYRSPSHSDLVFAEWAKCKMGYLETNRMEASNLTSLLVGLQYLHSSADAAL